MYFGDVFQKNIVVEVFIWKLFSEQRATQLRLIRFQYSTKRIIPERLQKKLQLSFSTFFFN